MERGGAAILHKGGLVKEINCSSHQKGRGGYIRNLSNPKKPGGVNHAFQRKKKEKSL